MCGFFIDLTWAVGKLEKENAELKAEAASWKDQCKRTAEGGADNIKLIATLKSLILKKDEALKYVVRCIEAWFIEGEVVPLSPEQMALNHISKIAESSLSPSDTGEGRWVN